MVRQFVVTAGRRRVGAFTMWLARRGWGPQVVLTTTGRNSGQPRPVPVSPLDIDGVGYIVSPYGDVNWVKNARINPDVRLQHGDNDRKVSLMELKADKAAPLLHHYWDEQRITRPYFDVGSNPQTSDFAAEATAHPVFRIIT